MSHRWLIFALKSIDLSIIFVFNQRFFLASLLPWDRVKQLRGQLCCTQLLFIRETILACETSQEFTTKSLPFSDHVEMNSSKICFQSTNLRICSLQSSFSPPFLPTKNHFEALLPLLFKSSEIEKHSKQAFDFAWYNNTNNMGPFGKAELSTVIYYVSNSSVRKYWTYICFKCRLG